jgi:hypothetical protein
MSKRYWKSSIWIKPIRLEPRKKNSGTPKILEVSEKHGIPGTSVKFQKFWVKFKLI